MRVVSIFPQVWVPLLLVTQSVVLSMGSPPAQGEEKSRPAPPSLHGQVSNGRSFPSSNTKGLEQILDQKDTYLSQGLQEHLCLDVNLEGNYFSLKVLLQTHLTCRCIQTLSTAVQR